MSPRKLAHMLIEEARVRGEKDALRKFFSFIEKRNLKHLIPAVIAYLERVSQEEERENTLIVESAFNISKELIKKVQEYVEASDAQKVIEITNPDLIGGFKAHFKGKLIDATIRRQLTKLRQRLVS